MSIRDAIWIIGIFVALGATWGMKSQRINAMERDIDRIENIFTKDQTTKQKLEEAKKFFPAVVDKRQKEADAVRADIQDLARTGTEQRLMNVDYDAGAKALEEAKKLATIDRLTSRGPQIFGQIFPKAEKSRQQRILDASSIVNPAHNIPGMREATGGYLYGFRQIRKDDNEI